MAGIRLIEQYKPSPTHFTFTDVLPITDDEHPPTPVGCAPPLTQLGCQMDIPGVQTLPLEEESRDLELQHYQE